MGGYVCNPEKVNYCMSNYCLSILTKQSSKLYCIIMLYRLCLNLENQERYISFAALGIFRKPRI
jgi:hypothetical protein